MKKEIILLILGLSTFFHVNAQVGTPPDGDPELCGGQPLPPGYKCCGEVPYKPNKHNASIQLDFSEANAVLDALAKSVSPAKGCAPPGALPTVSVNVSVAKECCDENIKDLLEITGQVEVNVTGFGCDIPIAGIPYLAEAGITFNAGISLKGNGGGKQTCDDNNLCISIEISGEGNIGVYGEILEGAVGVSGTGGAEVTGNGEYCYPDNTFTGQGCVSINATVEVQLIWLNVLTYQYTLGPYCS